jgi:hypothetical protein
MGEVDLVTLGETVNDNSVNISAVGAGRSPGVHFESAELVAVTV